MKSSQPKKRLFKLIWNKSLSHQRLSPKRKTRNSRKSLSNNRILKLNNKMNSRINCQLSNKKMLRKLKLRLIRLKKLKRSFLRPNSRSKNLILRRSSKPKNNNLSHLKSLRQVTESIKCKRNSLMLKMKLKIRFKHFNGPILKKRLRMKTPRRIMKR